MNEGFISKKHWLTLSTTALLGLVGMSSLYGCGDLGEADGTEFLSDIRQPLTTPHESMKEARILHTLTRMADGRFLATGGLNAGTKKCSAEIFDIMTETWSSIAPMPAGANGLCKRYMHNAILLKNDLVLVSGGAHDSGVQNSTVLYNAAANSWSVGPSMQNARYNHTATVYELNGAKKVLITGGYGGTTHASVESYDETTNLFTTKASMSSARNTHTATKLMDGMILAIGGTNGTTVLSSIELYNPTTNVWTLKMPMPQPRRAHTATLLGTGKVLVVGGVDMNGAHTLGPLLYDPSVNAWQTAGTMLSKRSGHTAELLPNGKVVVAGGMSGSTILSSVELYDPTTNTWTTEPSLSVARVNHRSAITSPGRVVISGGQIDLAGNGSAGVDVYRTAVEDWDLPSKPDSNLLPPEFTNTCFTQNDATPPPGCVANPSNANDLVFLWKPQCAGNFNLSTAGSTIDTVLYVQDVQSNASLGCNNNDGAALSSKLQLSGLAANQSVRIFVESFYGQPNCGSVQLSIERTPPLSAETCDGTDNDCDGETDEDNPGGGILCNTGVPGVCAPGTTECEAGQIICPQEIFPSSEICNAQDDDCDGSVDENNPGGGGDCYTGLPGVCTSGSWVCQAGQFTCKPKIGASAEVCDGKDNDCDGATDENNPPSISCAVPGKLGECALGATSCSSGSMVCVQTTQPSGEVCDGKDNDCNGVTDWFTECSWVCAGGSNAGKSCDGNIDCPGSICSTAKKWCIGGPNNGAGCSTVTNCSPCVMNEPPCAVDDPLCGAGQPSAE